MVPRFCNDLAAAEQHEWLITNGIGGFASGTVAGSATRRYHGLLIAALNPPVGRTFLAGSLDEIVSIEGASFLLPLTAGPAERLRRKGICWLCRIVLFSMAQSQSGHIKSGAACIEKCIWMRHGENSTYIQYTLLESAWPVMLELKALVNYRDFHAATHASDWRMRIEPSENGISVTAFEGATPFLYKVYRAWRAKPQHIWYRDFLFPRESERGFR